jgi:hypothetical protein
VLNFVLKDDATNTWYDNNNKNFAVSLRAPKAAVPGVTKAPEVPDQLPRALCDTWAWIKWDHAGMGAKGCQGQYVACKHTAADGKATSNLVCAVLVVNKSNVHAQ